MDVGPRLRPREHAEEATSRLEAYTLVKEREEEEVEEEGEQCPVEGFECLPSGTRTQF